MNLKPVHHKAILLMAEGQTNKAIAESLKVAPETVSSWRGDYDFKAALNKLLQANNQYQQDKIRTMATTALDTIENLMNDSECPPKDRLTAALKILELNKLSAGHIGETDPVLLQAEEQQSEELTKSFYNVL